VPRRDEQKQRAAAERAPAGAQLGDFGLSRLVDTGVHTHISTKTYGTVTYMPPEMLSQSRLTRAVDVYSFGILMWHLFTGQARGPPAARRSAAAALPACPLGPFVRLCALCSLLQGPVSHPGALSLRHFI
jgi:serine/threonine protein kinase